MTFDLYQPMWWVTGKIEAKTHTGIRAVHTALSNLILVFDGEPQPPWGTSVPQWKILHGNDVTAITFNLVFIRETWLLIVPGNISLGWHLNSEPINLPIALAQAHTHTQKNLCSHHQALFHFCLVLWNWLSDKATVVEKRTLASSRSGCACPHAHRVSTCGCLSCSDGRG